MAAVLTFGVLGPLEVRRDGVPVALHGAKWRPLLIALLLRPGQVVSDDRLIDDIWGEEAPAGAGATLRATVSRLRSGLEPGRVRGDSAVLARRGPGYVLLVTPEQLDAAAFEADADAGARALAAGDVAVAADRLTAALARWRGPALADVADLPFARGEATRLEERRQVAVEDRIAAELGLGRHAELASELDALVAGHPLRERLRELQVLALYRSGRQADALRAHQAARRTLAEEVGLEPGPGLRRLEERILRQDPDLDWVPPAAAITVAPLPAQAPEPAPGEPFGPRRLFVGRERELAVLAEVCADAARGRGGTVLLVGEAGVGKTATAEAALAQAAGRGTRVLVGRAYEGGGAPAFWPWVEALRPWVESASAAEVAALGPSAAVLAQMVPELAPRVPGLEPPPVVEADAARFRLFDAVAALVRRLGTAVPTAILLDDLHWADPASLLLLDFVARTVPSAAVALVATSRPPAPGTPTADAVASLARLGVRRIDLGGLATGDVAELLARTVGDDAVALADELRRRTDGNAFFVTEVVRLIADGGLPAGSGIVVPPSVRGVVDRRMAQLSPWARRLLDVAAVAGREVDLAVVAPVAGLSGESRLLAVDEVLADGLLRPSVSTEVHVAGPGLSDLRFAHDLVRDAVLDTLTMSDRIGIHRALAEALEGAQLRGRAVAADRLAHHYLQAAASGDSTVGKAVRYSRLAGDAAMQALAYEEAASLCSEALRVVENAEEPHTGDRAELHVRLGEAQLRTGQAADARRSFEKAASLAAQLDDATLLGRAALGIGAVGVTTGAVDKALVGLLEAALGGLPDVWTPMRIRLTTRLAMELYYSGSPERSVALSTEAVSHAERLGDPPALADALSGWHFCLRGPDNLDDRLAVGHRLLELAERSGDGELALRAHHERVGDLLELGAVAAVDDELLRYEKLAAELRQPRYDWQLTSWRAMRALLDGRHDDAEQLIEAAFVLGEPIQPETALQFYGVQLATLRREQDRLDEIVESVAGFADLFANAPAWRCAHLYMLAELDRHDEARVVLDGLAQHQFADLPRDVNWLPAMSLLSLATVLLGDRERAGQVLTLFEPFAGRNVVVGGVAATSTYGPAAYNLGRLHAFLGHTPEARTHYETAIRLDRAMGARGWLAHALHDSARLFLASPTPGDQAAGEQQWAEAAELAAQLDLRLLRRRMG